MKIDEAILTGNYLRGDPKIAEAYDAYILVGERLAQERFSRAILGGAPRKPTRKQRLLNLMRRLGMWRS